MRRRQAAVAAAHHNGGNHLVARLAAETLGGQGCGWVFRGSGRGRGDWRRRCVDPWIGGVGHLRPVAHVGRAMGELVGREPRDGAARRSTAPTRTSTSWSKTKHTRRRQRAEVPPRCPFLSAAGRPRGSPQPAAHVSDRAPRLPRGCGCRQRPACSRGPCGAARCGRRRCDAAPSRRPGGSRHGTGRAAASQRGGPGRRRHHGRQLRPQAINPGCQVHYKSRRGASARA
jgi:hypothetical protein